MKDANGMNLRQRDDLRILQPRAFGGAGQSLEVFLDAVHSACQVSPSEGWLVAILGVHSIEVAEFGVHALASIWGSDPLALVASSLAPSGLIEDRGGQKVLTGHWRFSSGCAAADWFIVGARSVAGRFVHVLVPARDLQVVADSWTSDGMRGTGSHDIVGQDILLDDWQVRDVVDLIDSQEHGSGRSLGFAYIFSLGVAAATVATAERVLGLCEDHLLEEGVLSGPQYRRSRKVLYDLASARFDLDSSWDYLRSQALLDERAVASANRLGERRRLRARCNRVLSVNRAVEAAGRVYSHVGTSLKLPGSSLRASWEDLMVAASHKQNAFGDGVDPWVDLLSGSEWNRATFR